MTRFCVRFPVTTWMIFVSFVVMGVYAIPRLKIEAVPDVNNPTLTVNTQWNGASPQAVQRSISIPIEEAVQDVHGIEKIESVSRAGNSTVTLSFRRDVEIDFARLELNEQLGDVRRNLPLGAMQPQILPFVPEEFRTEDFFTFSLESDLTPNDLRELAETWVIPQIVGVPGVADAEVLGGARPLLKIVLDRSRLELYGIRADEVFRAIDRLDEFEGAGVVREQGLERLVAVRRAVSVTAIRDAVVARRGGQSFTLGMVGEVRPGFEDPTYFVRANGQNVVQVSVDKRSGSNAVGVSRDLRAALPRIRAQVPSKVDFHIDEDQGKELEDKLRNLIYRSFAILGILFVMLALSVRQVKLTAIVIASIVFATLISLAMFYFLRISVNFITISGLAVSFGMIVDNSILVLDAIHRRLDALKRAEHLGLSRRAKLDVAYHAILDGTRDIVHPAIATTLTSVVVFSSFVFLSGRLALYYVPLAISVTTAMAASLFVAFGWVPMVLHRAWARPMVEKLPDGPRDVIDAAELEQLVAEPAATQDRVTRLDRFYVFLQRAWWLMVPVTVAICIGSWWVYDNKVIKGGFWRFPEQEELFLYLEMPSGTDVEVTSETLRDFEEQLVPVPEGARMSARAFGNQAILRVEFEESLQGTPLPLLWRELLIAKADETGGSSIFIRGFSDRPYFKGAFGGSALNSLVKITGYNSKRLNEISEKTLARVEKNRRARNARITTGAQWERIQQEEMVIRIRRERLAAHDLTVTDLTAQVRRILGVDIPWTMLIEGDQERVQLSYGDADNVSYADIAEIVVRNPSGEQVRLGDLIDIEKREVSRSITRENQKYTAHVNWEYLGTDQMRQAFIKDVLAGIELPYGYHAEEARQEFLTEEEEEEIGLALGLAVAFIFIVLAAMMESVTLPLLILLSIPMALAGVFVIFWLTSSVFDSSARIGLVLLFGVAVNNAILLVSRYRTEATLILKDRLGTDPELSHSLFPPLRKSIGGSDLWILPKEERVDLLKRAVARGSRVRMRSILLVSGTTIVGLAPLLVHINETADKDIWENLALATIGGLTSSTILLLVLTPSFYTTTIRLHWTMRRFRGWLAAKLFRRSRETVLASMLVLVALLAGCSDGGGGGGPVVPPPAAAAWRWVNPVAEGANLTDVWGASAGDLFATGTGGVVMRFDGASWRRTKTPVTANLNAIWGSAANDIVAVGQDGTIVRHNGAAWTTQASPTGNNLNDVWGFSANDVYAVGQLHTVLHFDGTAWSNAGAPAGAAALYSVWGSGPGNLYAAGLGKNLLHFDGAAWDTVATGASFALTAVWGASANEVFAVGGNGAAVRFDGVDWTPIDVGAPAFLTTVWGTAADDVYAMGQSGAAFHWDGFAWSPVSLRSLKTVARVFGVGGDVVAVGQAGTIFEKTGAGFEPAPGGLTVDFEDVYVMPGGGEAFVVGDFGTILHFVAGAWSAMPSGTTQHLRGLGADGAGGMIAVGENGTALRYDGASWSDISPGTPVHLAEAWLDGAGGGYAVGDGGTVLRWSGTGWAPVSIGNVFQPLLSVWGSSVDDVYVVGSNSTALRWNGTQWKNVVVDVANLHNFHAVHGTGPDDVFLATEYLGAPAANAPLHAGGLIFRWNGTAWTPVFQDPSHDVLSVWRASPTEGFACGDAAALLRNATGDGGWVRVWDLPGLPFFVTSVWGSSMKNVFIVGDNGTIARLSP